MEKPLFVITRLSKQKDKTESYIHKKQVPNLRRCSERVIARQMCLVVAGFDEDEPFWKTQKWIDLKLHLKENLLPGYRKELQQYLTAYIKDFRKPASCYFCQNMEDDDKEVRKSLEDMEDCNVQFLLALSDWLLMDELTLNIDYSFFRLLSEVQTKTESIVLKERDWNLTHLKKVLECQKNIKEVHFSTYAFTKPSKFIEARALGQYCKISKFVLEHLNFTEPSAFLANLIFFLESQTDTMKHLNLSFNSCYCPTSGTTIL